MTDQIEIAVTLDHVEKCRSYLKDRIRQLVIDTQYTSTPGAIAGYMADLRALGSILATDQRSMPKAEKTPSRQEHDAEMQKAARSHAKREKAALASD